MALVPSFPVTIGLAQQDSLPSGPHVLAKLVQLDGEVQVPVLQWGFADGHTIAFVHVEPHETDESRFVSQPFVPTPSQSP